MDHSDISSPKSSLSEILSSYFEERDEFFQQASLEGAKKEMEEAKEAFHSVLQAEEMIVRVYKELSNRSSS